jgi:hypothetical protein
VGLTDRHKQAVAAAKAAMVAQKLQEVIVGPLVKEKENLKTGYEQLRNQQEQKEKQKTETEEAFKKTVKDYEVQNETVRQGLRKEMSRRRGVEAKSQEDQSLIWAPLVYTNQVMHGEAQ